MLAEFLLEYFLPLFWHNSFSLLGRFKCLQKLTLLTGKMQVFTTIDPKYPYGELFEINISACHDDDTMCLNWSSMTTFRTQEFETLAGGTLNRYPRFVADHEGEFVIRTTAKCGCEKNDGEAEITGETEIIRTRLGITSKPTSAKIYFAFGAEEPETTHLVTPEILELGVPTQTFGHVKLTRPGYEDKTVGVSIVEGGKSEVHIVMKHL